MRLPRAQKVSRSVASDEERAEQFRSARKARQSELAEDYVELIADLIETTGEARSVDIAARLGVTGPTVAKTISRLQRDGFLASRPYRSIFLTEKGQALAAKSRHRHRIVLEFLHCIGVDEETAQTDAEGIEHHVSETTLECLERMIRRIKYGRGRRE